MIRVLSLGAGVQSSTLALMAAAGQIEAPDHAIFADTQWEPPAVYEWLRDYLIPRLPFPVHIVTKGNIREEQITARMRGYKETGSRWASLPYFTKNPDGSTGLTRRQCTAEYKIQPIEKKIRELLGLRPRQWYPKRICVEHWYGISADEIQRCKVEIDPHWQRNRYPLVERRMTRTDCLEWLRRHGHPKAPRSACIGCPFHSNEEWRDMKRNRPHEWADAVLFDSAIRRSGGIRGDTFLHRDCVPLDQANLRVRPQRLQTEFSFLDECAGMCGI